jgi:uncharacterized membrane protein YtjA (UPF0391 family)
MLSRDETPRLRRARSSAPQCARPSRRPELGLALAFELLGLKANPKQTPAGAGALAITRSFAMLYWAIAFFALALIAAVLGFGGIAASAAGVAKLLFFGFLIFGVISLLLNRRVAA